MNKQHVIIENVTGGIKHLTYLVDKLRRHIPFIKFLTILLSTGLWHFNTFNRV